MQAACHRAEKSVDGKGQRLVVGQVHAHDFGGVFVVANGHEGATDLGDDQVVGDPDHQRGDQQNHHKIHVIVQVADLQALTGGVKAGRATGHGRPVNQHHLHRPDKSQGSQGQVVAAHPQRGQTHHKAHTGRSKSGQWQGHPVGHAIAVAQNRHDVGTDAEKRRIGQRHLAGIAHQQIQAQGQDHCDADHGHDVQGIRTQHQRRGGQGQQQADDSDKARSRRLKDVHESEVASSQTILRGGLPNKPAGRIISTAIRMMKEVTRLKLDDT